MALVSCPKCRGAVSPSAPQCPTCGFRPHTRAESPGLLQLGLTLAFIVWNGIMLVRTLSTIADSDRGLVAS